ncbi:MAG: response regulator [Fibrobacteria bacterium]|nr:response regulator [Fibrobacteria bacterium]
MSVSILVVDDEENVLKSVNKLIKSKHPDYELTLTNSPSKALNKIKTGKFDLIITDLMMPGIDGLELIKKIRSEVPDLKIMMMTGFATMKTALLAMREGAGKYISKPFTRDELLSAVHEILADNQLEN